MQKTELDALRSYNEMIDTIGKRRPNSVHPVKIHHLGQVKDIFSLSGAVGLARYELATDAASYCRTGGRGYAARTQATESRQNLRNTLSAGAWRLLPAYDLPDELFSA